MLSIGNYWEHFQLRLEYFRLCCGWEWGVLNVLVPRGCLLGLTNRKSNHGDVMNWKHFPRYRPFVRGIHRSPANSPHKGQWRGSLMFSLMCAWINGWVNNREAGDLRRHRPHYDVIVMMNYDWFGWYFQCVINDIVFNMERDGSTGIIMKCGTAFRSNLIKQQKCCQWIL